MYCCIYLRQYRYFKHLPKFSAADSVKAGFMPTMNRCMQYSGRVLLANNNAYRATTRDLIMRLLRQATAILAGVLLSASVLAADRSYGYQEEVNNPGFYAMTGDLLIARPLLLGVTAIGTAAFVVSLPFTALAGNTREAGQELVVRPGRETFVRCLGCTRTGKKPETVQTSN